MVEEMGVRRADEEEEHEAEEEGEGAEEGAEEEEGAPVGMGV